MSDNWTIHVNRKKKILCSAVDCKAIGKHNVFDGQFCNKHSQQLQIIRNNVKQSRLNENWNAELIWRLREQQIRAVDIGHAYRILILQKKLKCLPIQIPSFEYFKDNKNLYESKKTTDDYIDHLLSSNFRFVIKTAKN